MNRHSNKNGENNKQEKKGHHDNYYNAREDEREEEYHDNYYNENNLVTKQHDVSHISASNSILDIRTLDDKQDNSRLLGKLETSILDTRTDEKERLQKDFSSSSKRMFLRDMSCSQIGGV